MKKTANGEYEKCFVVDNIYCFESILFACVITGSFLLMDAAEWFDHVRTHPNLRNIILTVVMFVLL